MGFLTPLYMAGILAVGLPILFHLIRRTPLGKQTFSSLMFLTPSPPRPSRRSRLSNLLLLLLRAAALILLAFAFSRPFFNQGPLREASASNGRRVAILVDTSASMRRPGLWKAATAQVERTLGELTPGDQAALYFFDRSARPAFTFDEWKQADPGRRRELLQARMAAASPTWFPTHLGDAVAAVADEVAERDAAKKEDDHAVREIVLISDLQQGSHAETLQGHQWPANVSLRVSPLNVANGSNAAVQWITQLPEDAGSNAPKVRLRVVNDAGSSKEQFTLRWANARGVVPNVPPVSVYLAPGHSQIVKLPWPAGGAGGADRVILEGDDVTFDNTLYVVPPQMESLRVLFVGNDKPEDVDGLLYYLQTALGGTPRRTLEVVRRGPTEVIGDDDLRNVRLAIVEATPVEATLSRLRRFAESAAEGSGENTVLVVLNSGGEAADAASQILESPVHVTEATGNFALLAGIDFTHPLFVEFNDPRFSDFTKIHFWKHRRLAWPEEKEVVARFDSGDPFLVEKPVGRGHVVLMTSGWQPSESQFALSTKFVPFIEGLVRRGEPAGTEGQCAVGDVLTIPEAKTPRVIITPEGKQASLPANGRTFAGTESPGIYTFASGERRTLVAVNVPPDESDTAPMPIESLERWGVTLAKMEGVGAPADPARPESERRLQASELEDHQKVWQWLIAGVLGLLAAETALAGRLSHRISQESPP